jgi:transposase
MDCARTTRLTVERRLEFVLDITARGLGVRQTALRHGVSLPTVRKWLARYRELGPAGLADVSSRPARSPRAIEPAKRATIVQLCEQRMSHTAIARAVGVSASTVGRVLARSS